MLIDNNSSPNDKQNGDSEYDLKTKKKGKGYCYCDAEPNKLNRDIFSFPYQPSLAKK